MKKLALILLLSAFLLPVHAQDSVSLLTTDHRPLTTNCENITMTATSTGLMGLGFLAAYQPDVNSWAVALRDEVLYYDPPKIKIDDYLQYLWLNAFKYGFAKERPDCSAKNSFPSGHTFTAFVGAEIIRREYGKEHPWIAVAAYGVATVVGIMRVYNNRHWAGDVLAGAGLGILSTTLVYWVLD